MFKRGQVALFVVIALVVVGAIVVFFVAGDRLGLRGSTGEFDPVFSAYSACIERETRDALAIAGSQGGHVRFEGYVPGSEYAPFSSHLFYLGASIPYWYGVTGNGLVKESIPTKSDIQQEIADYIESRLNGCDFSSFYQQGFSVESEPARASVSISSNAVSVEVASVVSASREDESATKASHSVRFESKFGTLYDQARALYEEERSTSFLENYAVDALRSYAPVDGVSVQCSPTIWRTPEIVENLTDGLQLTYDSLKFKGTGFTLANPNNSYFVVDHTISTPTRIIYSDAWPQKIEITPADDALMIANPIGNQEGLGVMGFCYVPYHFVYDVSFPVVMQLYDGNELFQFPVVVIVDNNVARTAASSITDAVATNDVCSFRGGSARISVYDSNLNPVSARLSYKCFDQVCDLGETQVAGSQSLLSTSVPLCYNGELIAQAEGYVTQKQRFSSNAETSADIVLERSYPVNIEVLVDGRALSGTAIVNFVSGERTISAALPATNSIELPEGLYNVSVFVYGNSSVVLPASTRTECTDVPRSGLAGFFGATHQECFSVTTPATPIDYALRGGGAGETYLLGSELETGRMQIYVSSLPQPTGLEQLQTNFEVFSDYTAEVSFA